MGSLEWEVFEKGSVRSQFKGLEGLGGVDGHYKIYFKSIFTLSLDKTGRTKRDGIFMSYSSELTQNFLLTK